MNLADWIIILALVVFVIQAVVHGFFQEIFSIAGLVFGYVLAAWQYHRLAEWFEPYVKVAWLPDVLGFLIIFVGVIIVAALVGRLASWVMKKAGLSGIDRVLGGVVGLLRGALTVAIVLVCMASFAPSSRWLEGSQLAPYFLVAGRAATWIAPSELRMRFYDGLDLLRKEAGKVDADAQRRPAR